ncbi:hypothetical protein Taro_006728 [Colocasia esculenta]|uniref:Aminotransferase-like plant mobile domain-containing protein n=1 Tax=Colocasia esculenta TaxID=4460 RepID=A0A843TTJ3_COLES|nr:hypothetical protein [Colocasia esculenta]
MGFGEILRMGRMSVDPALTQALRSRWDTEPIASAFPWGHMIPSLEDVSRIMGLRVYGRPVSGYTYPCYHELAEQLLDLPIESRSSLVPRAGKNAGESEDEYLKRLSRVSRRELASDPGLQADLDLRRFLVLFLGRLLFATRGDTVHCRFLPLLEDLGEVWAYLHLPALGRGDLTRPGLVHIARRWDSRRDTRHLADQLERLQEAIHSHPYLDVVWQPYLGEGDEGQPWLVQARPYFSRSFRGLHDTTDWRERAREQIENWERKGKAVKSDATTDDAYLQPYALKYGGKVYKSARHQVYVTGEIASLRALLYSAVQDREVAQRQTAELLLEARLTGAVLRAEEAQRHLEEGLRTRAEAAEAEVVEATRELAALRVQRPPGDQEEIIRLRAELLEQQTLARSLHQIVTDIGHSHSRSRSGASISRVTGASDGQYLAGSSSKRRNEEEERRRQGKGIAQDGRGGGEMLPPPDRQEGSGESGGGQ